MKIIVETKDLSNYLEYEDEITTEDLTEMVVDRIISEVVDCIKGDYILRQDIVRSCSNNIMESKSNIVDSIIDEVCTRIERKKKIHDLAPKKKDFNELDKEWEEYFTKLMDKCIAKKFR